MQVWLIDTAETLVPLTDRLPKVLLPICGKSMAELWLEQLCDGKITKVHWVSSQAETLEEHLGHGVRWGMTLHYHKPQEVTEAYQASGDNLVLQVDCLWDWEMSKVITHCETKDSCVDLMVGEDWAGVFVPQHARETLDTQRWRVAESTQMGCEGQRVDVQTLKDFHAVNLNILQGQYHWLKPAGRLVSERLYLNNMSVYKSDNLCSGYLYLGEKCKLHKTVVVQSNTVIGDHVIVDKEVKISQTVVLPDTYIGRFTEVTNAVVWGNVLAKIDSGVVIEIEDDFILGNLTQQEEDAGWGDKLRHWLRG